MKKKRKTPIWRRLERAEQAKAEVMKNAASDNEVKRATVFREAIIGTIWRRLERAAILAKIAGNDIGINLFANKKLCIL